MRTSFSSFPSPRYCDAWNMNFTQLYFKFNLIRNFCLALLALLVIFYIFQFSQLTEGMYLLKNYNNNIERISRENNGLEIKFLRANSLENLRFLVQNLNFDKVGEIDYLKIAEDAVVIKNR